MPIPINLELYKIVKKEADRKFDKPSAYKSGWLVKEYKKRGGEYSGKKPNKGLTRWFKEDWKDINPNKTKNTYPVYRPTKRITKDTPLTASEIDPVQAKKQIALKQKIRGSKNLPKFEGGADDPSTPPNTPPRRRPREEATPPQRQRRRTDEPTIIAPPLFQGIPDAPNQAPFQFQTTFTLPTPISNQLPPLLPPQIPIVLPDQSVFPQPQLISDLLYLPSPRSVADLHFTGQGKRIPRKKGQPAKSKNHSDLYTDEEPRGTIHGLKFATIADAKRSIEIIKNSGKTHAHKIQASVAMEQRARVAGKIGSADVYRKYIDENKFEGGGERKPDEFKQSIQHVFDLLAIRGKFNIIGSASNDEILYYSDFDLATFEKVSLQSIKKIFQNKFKEAQKDPAIFITDFKCGEVDGEPVRWNKKNIKTERQIVNGKEITLDECLLMPSTIKMDIIALIDGDFVEFSDNYYLSVNGVKNYDDDEVSTNVLLKELEKSAKEYYDEPNYFKYLKRVFSIKTIQGKSTKKLVDFFNSQVGLLNKSKTDLETLILVFDNCCRKPKLEDICNNIQIIKQNISGVSEVEFKSTLYKDLDKICSYKNQTSIIKNLKKVINYIQTKVNQTTLQFIKKNKI